MKTWNENNTLKRVRESEEDSYLEDLIRLINGEATVAIQYQIASNSIVGDNQSYLAGHFTEHTGEEWGHYTQLVEALMERGGMPNLSLKNTILQALPKTEELTSSNSEYLRDFFARAEENAIEAYQNFYDKIEDIDKDLADIINGIISDERAHKLDMERLNPDFNGYGE